MVNVKFNIERIDNGFIIETKAWKRFYRSLEEFIKSNILESMENEDKYFKEHDTTGITFNIKFEISEYIENDS